MHRRTAIALLWIALLFGCQASLTGAVEFPTPIRWVSPTASPYPEFPTREVSLTPTLAPTPTPRMYTVREGDTFGSIATKFGITVDNLIKANPSVDPLALPIGQVLVIPAPPASSETRQPTPTPVHLGIDPPDCYAQPSGGTWCLAMVSNPGSEPISSIFLRFSLYASVTADPSVARVVALPLTVLPAGARTVAAAYFSPEEWQAAIVRIEVISAVPTAGTMGILPLVIVKEDAHISADEVEVAAEFRIDSENQKPAKRLDAVLVLIDSTGRPIGFRIFRGEGDWAAGVTHRLTLRAFILAGQMDSYELILQARDA